MNLIRNGKIEQLYSQLQTRTKDIPAERMVTMERSLAEMVRSGAVSVLEAEKWVNHPSAFLDEMQRINEGK
jgi:Tfp pilus assembly pilus retraction ATPase PilT